MIQIQNGFHRSNLQSRIRLISGRSRDEKLACSTDYPTKVWLSLLTTDNLPDEWLKTMNDQRLSEPAVKKALDDANWRPF